MTRARSERRGFALIAVVWAIAMIGVLAAEFYPAVHADLRVAANARAAARARWIAHGALARTLDALDRVLAADSAARVLAAAGDTLLPPLTFEHEGIAVRAVVLDARARLNINVASADELERLFVAVGIGVADARALAQAVAAAREGAGGGTGRREAHRAGTMAGPDPRRPARAGAAGATEPGHVARAGAMTGPAPREPARTDTAGIVEPVPAFQLVEEVSRLPGVHARTFAAAAPHLTTAGDGRINVNSSAMPVLLTLPGIDSAAARSVLERRRRAPFSNVFELLGSLPAETRQRIQADIGGWTDRVAFAPRTVEIVVDATPTAAAPVRARLFAEARLAGGSSPSLVRVIER